MSAQSAEPKTYPARYAVLFMLALGLAGAVGSALYYRSLQRRPLEFWGAHDAELIVRAAEVDVLRLAVPPADERKESLVIDGVRQAVVERRAAARAPGCAHLRAALVNDHSFLWDAPTGVDELAWTLAITFRSADDETTVLLDPQHELVGRLDSTSSPRAVRLTIMPSIARFVAEQFAEKVSGTK